MAARLPPPEDLYEPLPWHGPESGRGVVTADDLLVAVADGDQDAFSHLYDRMVDPVRTLVRGFVSDPDLVDRVVGEVMLELWRTAPEFDRTRSSASRTILSLARRRALEHARGPRRGRSRGAASPFAGPTSDAERLRAVLATLPPSQRHALHLAVHSGATYHEVAGLLDTTPAAVLAWMRAGLRQLHVTMGAPIDRDAARLHELGSLPGRA